MLKRNWADLLFAQKCCIFALARPRTPRQIGASSVSFCPEWPKNRPGEGATAGRIIFSKCFVVFSTCRIIFRKCFLVSPKQPADCSRRLKTLKLRRLGDPISRSVRSANKGAATRKADACTDRGPDRTTRRRRSTKRPQRVKTRHFDVKMRFPLYKEAVIHKFYLYLPRKKILLWPKLNYYPCSPGC